MHGILTLYDSIQTGDLTRRRDNGGGAGIEVAPSTPARARVAGHAQRNATVLEQA